ncbi:MAG: hypothetical protein QOE28_31 [Solirubrobacteraceae bacterium]|nr:hypothetical protein [Solirubrobacteraceae bacterium]
MRRLPLGLPALFATALVALVASGAAAGGEAATPTPTPTPSSAATAKRSAEPQAPLSFGRAAYTWTVKEFPGKLAVEVVNETGADITDPVVEVSSSRLTDSNGASVTAADVISRTLDTTTVPSAGSVIAELRMRRKLPPGTYSARLSAGRSGSGPVAHATVSIVFPGAKAPPEPFSDKQTVQAVRWIPFWDRTVQVRGSWIPLHAEPDVEITSPAKLDLEDGTLLGALAGDQGGVAAVRSIDDVKKLPSRVPGVQFEAAGFDGPGKYTGTLDLLPDDEKAGTVEMTIVTKDAVIWPIIALGLGIGIALRVVRWRNVTRRVIVWERRIRAAEEAYAAAEKRMELEKGAPSWATYRVSDFAVRAEETKTALREARQSSATSVAKDREQRVEDGLTAMRAATADLDSVRDTARALDAALKRADLTPVEGLPGAEEPAWAVAARALLNGASVPDAELRARLTEMQVTTEFLTGPWKELRERVGRDATKIERAKPKARRKFEAAWQELWDNSELDADRLEALAHAAEKARAKAVGVLATARRRARRVTGADAALPSQRFIEARVAAAATGGPGLRMRLRFRVPIDLLAGVFVGGAALLGNTPNKVAAIAFVLAAAGAEAVAYGIRWVRGQFARDELRLGDTVVVALAVVVAIVTGLTALYFGKTFGTPSDYLTAALWGLSTAGAVSGIAEVLQALADPDAPPAAAAAKAPAA